MQRSFSRGIGGNCGKQTVASKILLLAPRVYDAYGGVETYMRRMVEIMAGEAGESGGKLGCLSLSKGNRRPELPEPVSEAVDYRPVASKAGYALAAARLAGRMRPRLAVVGHIGLSPVAWLLHRLGLIPSYALVLHGREVWQKAPLEDGIAARGARYVVATTGYTARVFAQANGIRPERLRVLPLGLGASDLPPLPERPAGGRLKVLSVARLVSADSYKGVDTLIEATATLRRRGLGLHLDVAGSGDDVPRLRELTRSLGVEGNVRLWGRVESMQLHALYRDCDLFAMPSRKEGFGIVFLEAMQHGKPCIGGNHGGTPEVIEHGSDGWLVEHGDVEALAGRLQQMARDPGLRIRMGLKARRKVAESYLFPHFRRRWVEFLGEATGPPREGDNEE